MKSQSKLSLISIMLILCLSSSTVKSRECSYEIVHSFPAPSKNPMGLAYDGELLWTADGVSKEFIGFSPKDGSIVSRFTVPVSFPIGITYDGEYFRVNDIKDRKLILVDKEEKKIVDTFPSPVSVPTGIQYCDGIMWICDTNSPEMIKAIEEDGLNLLHEIPAPGKSPFGIAIDQDCIWVSDNNMSGCGSIHSINPEKGKELGSFTFKEGGGAFNGLESVDNYLWVISSSTDTVYQLKVEI